MKKLYYSLLTAGVLLSGFGSAMAQECLAGGCTLSASQWPAGTRSTTSTTFTPIATDMFAGEFSVCNVSAGTTYQWSLCAADGGVTGYDSELTLFDGLTSTPICYSDDDCGSDAKIGWTATFTGTVFIQVNQFNCLTNTTNTTLVWKIVAAAGTDAAVSNVYTMGTISATHSDPHVVRARISNLGSTTLLNRQVTLTVSGANTFSNVQTITSLAPGNSTVVTFAGYNSLNTGTNIVTVSVPTDLNPTNNTSSVSQIVNNSSESYGYGTLVGGGVGFNTGNGEVTAKYYTSIPTTVTQVNVPFNTAGQLFRMKIWTSTAGGLPGTVLYTSPVLTAAAGADLVTVSPAVAVSGNFFIGVEQVTLNTNMALGYQTEAPIRTGSFFYNTNLAAPLWTDFSPGLDFRLLMEPVFGCSAPATPATITGAATACAGNTLTYSVPAVTGATSYTWTLPGGWTGFSTSNSINVTAGGTGGTISVVANNSCGSSAVRTLAVTASAAPSQPAAIAGNSAVCSGTPNTYSITPVTGATSYLWTLPAGWSGASTGTSISATAGASGGNITVRAVNTCGNSTPSTMAVTITAGAPAQPGAISGSASACTGSTVTYTVNPVAGASAYNWTLPSGWSGTSTTNSISVTTGSAGGTLSVTASNGCGTSAPRTLAVTTLPVPAQPAAITGAATVCQGATTSYTAPVVTGATSYSWTLPGGWSGTSTSNVINATAGTTGGTITVTANNACGASLAQTIAVTASAAPVQPVAITGATSACQGNAATYSIAAVAGATSYNWTLPAGWAGTSTGTSISATAGTNGGTISVTATNACGTSTAQTLAVTIGSGSPAQPGAISGNATVCAGSSVTYTVAPVTGASTYTWNLPTGWTGASTTNTITATAGSSGSISVTAGNSCGTSPAQNIAVNVNSIAQPAAITGNAALCSGSAGTYSVPAVTGASAYNWTLPSGWSGTSATNTINVTAGTAGGAITVTATDGTCTSAPQTFTATVNPLPAIPVISAIGNVLSSSAATGNQWNVNGNPIPGGTSQFYTATGSGFFTVTVTDANGCSATSAPFTFTGTGKDNADAAIQLTVFPNPAQGEVRIQADNAEAYMVLTITNVLGAAVAEVPVAAKNGQLLHTLDVSGLRKGLYLLTLKGRQHVLTTRLVVQ